MATVKLFNLSEKVQVLTRKAFNEENETYKLNIEVILDHEEVGISMSLNHEYKTSELRDEMFETKASDLNVITDIANTLISNVMSDDKINDFLIPIQ